MNLSAPKPVRKATCFVLPTVLMLALAGCGEKVFPPPIVSQPKAPSFRIDTHTKRALVEKALTLKHGDSYQTVTNVLGNPTFDQTLDRKEDGRNIGRDLKYYVVIWEKGMVNEFHDELVGVYLDERGLVQSIRIKVTLE